MECEKSTLCAQINWEDCNKEVLKVKGFLNSLNVLKIKTGLVIFDSDHFCLSPRSHYINNHAYQWIATIGDKRATFPRTLTGFTQLIEKVRKLENNILTFFPEKAEDCSTVVQRVLNTLIKIQLVINGVAQAGLNQLCVNYRTANKISNAQSLQALGTEAFDILTRIKGQLSEKMVPLIPTLAFVIQLEQYSLGAKKILKHHERNRKNLLSAYCTPKDGLIISVNLIVDCIRDAKQKNKNAIKESLRIAANFMHVPELAQKIPIHNDEMEWVPKRPVTNREGVVSFEEGVTGTCERDGNGIQNLCNIYYRIDPKTKHPIISCGAIDTQVKAEQLIPIVCEVVELLPRDVNGRWVIHGLNSFYHETNEIQNLNRLIPNIEGLLQEKLNKQDIFLSQINTVFNAASSYASEDSQSFKEINSDSLVQFISYAFEDVNQLIKESEQKFKKEWHLSTFFGTANLPSEPMESNAMAEPEHTSKIFYEMMGLLQAIKELKKTINLPSADLESKASLSADSLAKQLAQKQAELEEKLKAFYTNLKTPIERLKELLVENEDIHLKKALLILNVLEQILALQLKCQEIPPLSRCAEVELFLLFYRLLNIKAIIICLSGLDRSGTVRALADTQSIFEAEWMEEKREDKQVCLFERDISASTFAHEQMFNLITHLDSYQEELLKLTNSIIAKTKNSYYIIKDLQFWPQAEPSENKIRDHLFEKIDEKYFQDPDKANQLKIALRYMERYANQLLTEMIKTIYSTGAAGLKWLHDASWPTSFFANPHPSKRLPPLISTDEGHTIQILELIESWYSNTMTLTPAGISLLLRIGQLRGK